MRLQSYLSRAGVASRRGIVPLIEAGRVTVNGSKVFEPGHAVDPSRDKICFDGMKIGGKSRHYYLFHKPRNVITTLKDTHGRKTVSDFFKTIPERLYPVGRLDQDSTGLLIMTNDGDLAYRLTHPQFGCFKIYEVVLYPALTQEALRRSQKGLSLEGKLTAPCRIEYVGKRGVGTLYRFTLKEGRKRQIRLMAEAVGSKVFSIHRIQVGALRLGSLRPGMWRPLTRDEVKKLLAQK